MHQPAPHSNTHPNHQQRLQRYLQAERGCSSLTSEDQKAQAAVGEQSPCVVQASGAGIEKPAPHDQAHLVGQHRLQQLVQMGLLGFCSLVEGHLPHEGPQAHVAKPEVALGPLLLEDSPGHWLDDGTAAHRRLTMVLQHTDA